MAEPTLTNYIPIAAQVITSITGVVGGTLGIISYVRVKSMKSLELRLELRKAANDVQVGLSQLKKLIEKANQSRQNVASARGLFESGDMEIWKRHIEEDKKVLNQLYQNAPAADKGYDDQTLKELESKSVEVHRLQLHLDELKNKYDAAIREDIEQRKHIREASLSKRV